MVPRDEEGKDRSLRQPTQMNRRAFARNIAQSLVSVVWATADVERKLRQRLPHALHKFAPPIADHLMSRFPQGYAPSWKAAAVELLASEECARIYSYCMRNGVWPAPDLTPATFIPAPPFAELEIPPLAAEQALADYFFVEPARLAYLTDRHSRYEEHGETAINHYHYVFQKKRTKGIRVIEAPKNALKGLQRQILTNILQPVPTHPDAFGFVKGRNCQQAAQRHVGEEVVICFDFRDYFASIGAGRVFGLFRCLGYPHTVARYLTALCTTSTPPRILERLDPVDRALYRMPHLPQGAPTSPALANHVTFALDRRLSGLARRLGLAYSRYADDLTFSGDHRHLRTVLEKVPDIVRQEGFSLNTEKTRVMRRGARQQVTGIVVNERLNVSRDTFDHLKAIIHSCSYIADPRLDDPSFVASLLGKIEWVGQVNPRRGEKLRHLLDRAARKRM